MPASITALSASYSWIPHKAAQQPDHWIKPVDGKYLTSCHIYERLICELDKNLAIRVEETGGSDSWTVFGRNVFHLLVLIETMRCEGYELQDRRHFFIEPQTDVYEEQVVGEHNKKKI